VLHLSLHHVTKRYGALKVLDDVSFEVPPGVILALLGPNGAGKTTLLRCLTGLASPTQGEVRYDQQPFDRSQLSVRQRVAFLPDFPAIYARMTVLQHLGMVLNLYGRAEAPAEERVVELLRKFDLLPLAEFPVGTLSRGQIYKAGLIALLAVEPEILFLDEPFASGMDPAGLSAFKEEARALVARGGTLIYSTQIVEVVERFADTVCVLHKGELRAFGRLDELRAGGGPDGALEALFARLREEEGP
jgi:ABC-type multidrug transport system ATPase subunit